MEGPPESGYRSVMTNTKVLSRTERAATPAIDPRWAAVASRDPAFDGRFVYAVKTTGIYCRPTCPSRRPHLRNVAFYAIPRDAERAGFRACRRCRPNEPDRRTALVTAACRRIAEAASPLSLDALAAAADISKFHLHRIFKKATGLTPRAYAAAHRARRARKTLAEANSVTEAIYDAGFNSAGRFYENSTAMLGMTPRAFRKGGRDTEICFAIGDCSLGAILVARSTKGICAILLGEDPDALAREIQDCFPNANLIGGNSEFEALVAQVVGFVDAPQNGLDLPLDIRGTAFQQRVWQALRKIPVGETASYAEIARRIGAPASARAVARACAENVIAVAIPCHRVICKDGTLSGYRSGAERKRALLEKEHKG
jgi:AraC family transcriptional regulator, regulatory protein of adaptative response / methylated-DNA-[protein]-cysteine methyltransferase